MVKRFGLFAVMVLIASASSAQVTKNALAGMTADTIAPIVDNVHYGPSTGVFEEVLFNVHDSAANDFGMQSVAWMIQSSGPPSNFVVTATGLTNGGAIGGCPKSVYTIDIKQHDSIDGCIVFVFRDCAGNERDTAICFESQRRPVIAVQSRTGSYDGSICNARTTYILATDTSTPMVGFAGATTLSATNMAQIIWAPPHAFNILPIAVHVLDSMYDGQIILRIVGNDSGVTLDTITYCTIPDTLKPLIQIFLTGDSNNFEISVSDNRPWDRGIRSIQTEPLNVAIDSSPSGNGALEFFGHIIDPRQPSGFCISATDGAGHRSDSCFAAAGKSASVRGEDKPTSLRIYPNPSTDIFMVRVGDADPGVPAQAEVLDVLGRTVARFAVQGTATFDASALPAGTYIVRVGGMSGRIVKQ